MTNYARCIRTMTMTLLIAGGASSCGRGIFNTEPLTDMTRDEQNRAMAADTPRNWQEFQWDIDPQIEEEKLGKPAPGFQTWNEKWIRALAWI